MSQKKAKDNAIEIHAKVATLEADISNLAGTMKTQSETVGRLFGAVDRLREELKSSQDFLAREISKLAEKSGRINPMFMIGLVSLILSFVIYHNRMTLDPLWDSMKEEKITIHRELDLREKYFMMRMDHLEFRIKEAEYHTKEKGHPYVQTERIESLNEKISLLSEDRIRRKEVENMFEALKKENKTVGG